MDRLRITVSKNQFFLVVTLLISLIFLHFWLEGERSSFKKSVAQCQLITIASMIEPFIDQVRRVEESKIDLSIYLDQLVIEERCERSVRVIDTMILDSTGAQIKLDFISSGETILERVPGPSAEYTTLFKNQISLESK